MGHLAQGELKSGNDHIQVISLYSMVAINGYPPLKSSYDKYNYKSVLGEPRPPPYLEILFYSTRSNY